MVQARSKVWKTIGNPRHFKGKGLDSYIYQKLGIGDFFSELCVEIGFYADIS